MRGKSLLPGLMLLTATVANACDGDETLSATQQAPVMAVVAAREGADPAVIHQVVAMHNTGLNGGGWATAEQIYAPDAVFHTPGFPQITNLPSLIAELTWESVHMIHNFHVELVDVFAAGDMVVGRFTATGDWAWQVPAPVPYVNPWIVFFRFEDGKIAEEWWEYDVLGVMEQIGAVPSTRSAYGWSTPSTVAGDPGVPQQNASLARRAIQFVNTGNVVLADHVLSPAYVHHEPDAPMATDRNSLKLTVLGMVRAAFPDVQLTIEHLVASGDRVGVRFTGRGTHLGAFGGIPATGRRVEWTCNAIYRIADRQIVEGWMVWDLPGLLQQIRAP